MADIMIRADKVSSTIQRIREAQEAALAFRSELATVKRSLLFAEGDLCGVEGTLAALRAMADAQERRAEDLGAQADRIEAFAQHAGRIDHEVAELIERRHKEFMERYSYLRPEHEKGWLDRVGGWLAPVAEWCKEHWIEIAIGIACIVAGALLTFATGGAFLPALLLGLKSAAMAGLISGGVSAGISVIGSIMSGDSLEKAFFETADAFGDGLASGFMFGGILAGGSQGMAAAFRLSSSAKVKAINFGKIRLWSPNGLKNKNPGGTLLKIGKTFRFDFEATKHLFHTHIPKSWFNSFPKTLQGMKWLFEAGKSDVHVNLTELLGGVWGGIHSR